MDFVLKLLAFILILYVAQSRETVRYLKSFKLKPSFSISKPENQIESERKRKKIIECPNGTVPILKNTKQYVANAQYWAEKHYNPLTVESHGTHIAGVRSQGQGPYHGLAAWMSIHNLNISKEQASYANIYVGSGVNNKINFIQAGWMINPKLFGDGRTWSYGFWKGANGTGCYNTICHGFVQVSKTDVLSGPLPYDPKGEKGIYFSIVQDKNSGNWWISDVNYTGSDEQIGYWPKELFDLISNSVDMIGVGGVVQASPSGVSPPMGNGNRPTEDDNASARVTKLEIVDSNYKIKESDKYKLEKLLDNDKCYGLKDGKKSILFTYGGPGGDSCGI